ncbi:MAG: ParA family protein [Burkholderiales bacterium]|nr:ParA family protein [Burkholderiales bacterium]
MPVFVVANPKGGVGKSTFATNLAGYFASRGHKVVLGDVDVQQSSRSWLAIRPPHLPAISPWEIGPDNIAKPPRGTTHIVLDTPAGFEGPRFNEAVRIADKVIVPLQPSMFDILATQAFLQQLSSIRGKVQVGVLGMRVDRRTKSAEQLEHYVRHLGLPVLGFIRNTQNYVQLASQGATVWDAAPSRVEKDLEEWEEILKWVEAS